MWECCVQVGSIIHASIRFLYRIIATVDHCIGLQSFPECTRKTSGKHPSEWWPRALDLQYGCLEVCYDTLYIVSWPWSVMLYFSSAVLYEQNTVCRLGTVKFSCSLFIVKQTKGVSFSAGLSTSSLLWPSSLCQAAAYAHTLAAFWIVVLNSHSLNYKWTNKSHTNPYPTVTVILNS